MAKEQGISVILVEQDITKALRVADRGYVVENGKITLEGTSEELESNEHVTKDYLGIYKIKTKIKVTSEVSVSFFGTSYRNSFYYIRIVKAQCLSSYLFRHF